MRVMIGVTTCSHVRIEREDADDGCVSTVQRMALHSWKCPRCGYQCKKHDYICGWCSWERKDHGWRCPECDHLNKAAEKECELCGRRKPDGV